jgi:hypothetical protein
MWEPQPLTTLRVSKACRGENFTFLRKDCSRKIYGLGYADNVWPMQTIRGWHREDEADTISTSISDIRKIGLIRAR